MSNLKLRGRVLLGSNFGNLKSERISASLSFLIPSNLSVYLSLSLKINYSSTFLEGDTSIYYLIIEEGKL